MSGIMKPISWPAGTLYRGKLEVEGHDVYVEAFVKDRNLIFSINKWMVQYESSVLLENTLIQIGNNALERYKHRNDPPKLEEENKNDIEMPIDSEEVDA